MRHTDVEGFKNYFRMSPSKFDQLLEIVEKYLPERQNTFFREALSPSQRLAVTLRYLASGDSMVSLAYSFCLGKSTVSKAVRETCNALWNSLQPLVLVPPTQQQWEKIAEEFNLLWQFPNCVGAIDGKHVAIQAPACSGSLFYNYKGYFSLVLMAACDAKYCFTLVDIGGYGRSSDGGIFSSSKMGQKISSGTAGLPPPVALQNTSLCLPHVFVADEAFPLKPNIMRPFPGKKLSMKQTVYNYRLSRARRCIENAFGIMSSRFRIFHRPINTSLETAEAIVKACVCLHNFLKASDDSQAPSQRVYCPPGMADAESSDGAWRLNNMDAFSRLGKTGSNRSSEHAASIREAFATHFFTQQ